ncbi:hypothetical protein [Nostoc sp. LPT]|uniref:hypothetical protein n=1 Tax=Nostoc sp. LPT TaxID=2815387 RepID=UPI001DC91D26|nr:hypothetical protein [Nostoc sp. LPT]MBN4003360.1 hypothetical protein [Nostoc sp. LPT]
MNEQSITAIIELFSGVAALVEDLTEQEQSDRLYLERRMERAFFEAGIAVSM